MSQEKYCGKGHNAMITEMDEVKCKNTFDLIDTSSLEPKTKADLKESVEEAKLNLNGRSVEERLMSIARNQFDMTRFTVEIIIQFKKVAEEVKSKMTSKKSWADVVSDSKWPLCILGSVISVCCIFQPQIVELLKAIGSIIR